MIQVMVDIIGWIGALAVLMAYLLVSTNRVKAQSYLYQLMNMIGSVFLIINTFYFRAFPSAFLNIMWAAIAVFAILRLLSKKNRGSSSKIIRSTEV